MPLQTCLYDTPGKKTSQQERRHAQNYEYNPEIKKTFKNYQYDPKEQNKTAIHRQRQIHILIDVSHPSPP